MEAPTTIIRINEEEDDTFCISPVSAADEEPEPAEPTSGTHSTATDAKPPATSKNLRGSQVRDSLDISNHAAYIERKCLGDKSELGHSNATERTVDTVATGTSLDDDEEEFESPSFESPPSTEKAPESITAADMLQRQPAKSAMKHKTLQDSLSTQYESTRRKMVRERQLAAKRARKLARAQSKKQNGSSRRIKLKKAISKMSLVSRRNLFDASAGDDAVDPDASAKPSGDGPPSRRGSMASERSGLSKSKSSMDVLSSSEHRVYEEEHNDTVSEMPMSMGKIDRRASLSSFKSSGSHPNSDGEQGPGNDNSSARPAAPTRSTFQNKSMRSMRSMRNLLSTSKSRLLGNSLTSLFSHGSKSECFTVDEQDDAELFPTLLSFDTVEIREYDPEVDANPCTSRGPAITLGWTYTTAQPVDFYQYEEYRPPRRQMKEMRLPREVREQRLMASGVSRSEMDRSIKQANIAKQRRSKTLRQLKHYTLHERLEGMKKKCLKMMGKRQSHEEEERKLWEEAQCYFAA